MKLLRQMIDRIRGWYQTNTPGHLEEADAMILGCYPTGSVKEEMIQSRVLLQVTPKQGRNYVAEYQEYFSVKELAELPSGLRIKIYYQRNNPMKIHLPARGPDDLSGAKAKRHYLSKQ